MSRRNKNQRLVKISKFICTECGFELFLPRPTGKQREKNHLKKLYCIRCQKEINHIEIRSCDYR